MIQFLAESKQYKVYSIEEIVYLKDKLTSNVYDDYEENDKLIACHYGDPTGAIFIKSGKHLIVSGCGLTIYNIEQDNEITLFDSAEQRMWTNGLHQDELDDQSSEFRFVAYNKKDKLRVFKYNLETKMINQID